MKLVRGSKAGFTPLQGRYLAFIHAYTTLHGVAPAEADMRRFFRVTPPSVHRMVVALEDRALVERVPGKARSIKILISPDDLPELEPLSSGEQDRGTTAAYDMAQATRGRTRGGSTLPRMESRAAGRGSVEDEDMAPLSAAEVRELRRRLEDARDPTRYLLVSEFGPKFKLYYNVSDDVYAMNEPKGATLFKRRETALAVKSFLGPRIKLVRCTTRREKGERVPVLPDPRRPSKGRKK